MNARADLRHAAEWAFRYLRRNAQATRERLIQREIERSYQKEKDNDQTMACNGRSEMIPNITVQSAESDEDDGWHSASSTIGVLDETDIIAYRAYSQGSVGRLVIYSGGIRFVRSLKRKDLWRRSFLDLAEMRKQDGSSVSKLPTLSSQSLELKFMDGSTMAIKGMRDRDSAFNTIIGFSGLQWQSLQAKTVQESSDNDLRSTS